MNDVVDEFVQQLRNSRFESVADAFQAAFKATDIEADWNVHATVLYEALTWVIEHKNRSIEERIKALDKLISHDGSEIELHAFTGWME